MTLATIKALAFTIDQYISNSLKNNCGLLRGSVLKVIFESADIYHAIKVNFETDLPERFFESFIYFNSGNKSLWFLNQLNLSPDMDLAETFKSKQREKNE